MRPRTSSALAARATMTGPVALLLLVPLLWLAAGCRRVGLPPVTRAPAEAVVPADPNARLDALVAQYRSDLAQAAPVAATWLGIHGEDDKLDDTSTAAQAREAARLQHVLGRLEGLPPASLDASHRLDRALIERHARLGLFELTEIRSLERNPVRYVSIASAGVYELIAGDVAPLPERLRAVVARLNRVRPLYDEARKNLSNPSEVATRRAIELAQSTRGFLAETLPRVVTAVGDDRLLADFRTAQGDALRAFDDLINFLQKDLLARSHGVVALGRDRLLAWLRLRESLELAPETLLSQLVTAADRELKAAQRRFEESARQVAPGKSTAETLRLLDEDHPAADQLLSTVQQAVDEVYAHARERRLLSLAAAPPRAQPMPPYLWGYALVQTAGPFEPRGDHALYVDPVNSSWDGKVKDDHLRAFGRAQLTLFAVHEPLAHIVQANAQRHAPSVAQQLTASPAFAEGFPRYLEQLLLDDGPGTGDPRLRFVQRREALLALCRFSGALKLHAQGARIDDVVRVFGDSGGLDDSVARREAERVAVDPMVLDEALGMLALARLREQATSERAGQGEELQLGAFHDALLSHGALPLGLLRQQLLEHDVGPVL